MPFNSISNRMITRLPKCRFSYLHFVFINDVGTYVTSKHAQLSSMNQCIIRVLPKVYGKHGKSTLTSNWESQI